MKLSQIDPDGRLRHACDLDAAFLREYSGLHEDYDGLVADLSPPGIKAALGRLGGSTVTDAHDEAQLSATENAMRVRFGKLEQHRWGPWVHLEALDLTVYSRDYADEDLRVAARRKHLELWPDIVANAIESLDQVPAPVADAFVSSTRGMETSIAATDDAAGEEGLNALRRLVKHLELLAHDGETATVLGREGMLALICCEDGITTTTDELVDMAERECTRMQEVRAEAAAPMANLGTVEEISKHLRYDHGDFDTVLVDTQREVKRAVQFVAQRQLLPLVDDQCSVAASPPARSWAPARVSWVAPWESRGHSVFHISSPQAGWSIHDQSAWLDRFNRAAVSVVALHEVTPGHCSHALTMGRLRDPIRRTFW